ncbi:MAG: tol-pal system YbgF family protein [Candidatus Methylomirabilia bacterium]
MPGSPAVVAFALLLTFALPSSADIILDPELIEEMLRQIAEHAAESREGRTREARADAVYHLGERAEALVSLLNRDIRSHGESSLFAQLLLKRLRAYSIKITFAEPDREYAYDLAAFREYLRRAPEGQWAAEARFKVIARTFHDTLGVDPATLVNTDLAGLLRAIAREEQFLVAYPGHERAKDVQFFLAVDYYRISQHTQDQATASEYAGRARRALEQFRNRFPGSIEARAAEALLERLVTSEAHGSTPPN